MAIHTALWITIILASFVGAIQGLECSGCYNGGQCPDPTGNCTCPEPFIGPRCETLNGSCIPYGRQACNGEVCNDSTGRCRCQPGQLGPTCFTFSVCNPSPCGPNGTCVANATDIFGFHCDCQRGFAGAYCDVIPNPCRFFPGCVNGNCQVDENLQPFCRCHGPQFHGDRCENDHCETFECENGRCQVDFEGTPSCQCDPYTTGPKCEVDIDECTTGPYPCYNGGTCQNTVGGVTCICPSSTSGTYCELGVNGTSDACNPNPCQNGGRCRRGDVAWLHECRCDAGWWGSDNCATSACERESNVPQGYNYEEYDLGFENLKGGPPLEHYCFNGGTCMPSEDLPECLCAAGFLGDRCQRTEPIFESISPIQGLKSGGSKITLKGQNLNYRGPPQITFGSLQCPVDESNRTVVFCISQPLANTSLLDVPQAISVLWQATSTEALTDETFTYLKDPEITKVEPLESIISGGILLTVTGSRLTSVSTPQLIISVVYKSVVVAVFETICQVSTADTMLCPTPNLEIFDKDGSLSVRKTKEREFGPILPPPPRNFGPTRRKRAVTGTVAGNEALYEYSAPSVGEGNRKKRFVPAYPFRRLHQDTLIKKRLSRFVPAYPYVSQSEGNALSKDTERKRRFVPAHSYESLGHLRPKRQSGTSAGDQSEKVASVLVNNKTLDFYIGFRLDGLDTYENLSAVLPQYSQLTVFIDPVVNPWEISVRDFRTFAPFNHESIEFTGEHLSRGLRASDYYIYVGKGRCTGVELATNRIFCNAPTSKPEKGDDENYGVMVQVGQSGLLTYKVGQLNYQTSVLEYPPARAGIIAACVIAGVILLCVVAYFVWRKRS